MMFVVRVGISIVCCLFVSLINYVAGYVDVGVFGVGMYWMFCLLPISLLIRRLLFINNDKNNNNNDNTNNKQRLTITTITMTNITTNSQ